MSVIYSVMGCCVCVCLSEELSNCECSGAGGDVL